MELVPVHNLYWRKYLTYGYHSLISLWDDEYGLPIKSEYKDVLKECMNFFLEKEEYLDCAKVRDLLEGKLQLRKRKQVKEKSLI